MSSVQSTRARLLAVAIAWLAAPAAAEDDVIENYESERCVRVSAINSTRVVNDGNVLFYMRGRKVYLNTLRAQCIGLAREKRFSYRVYTGQLCERDRISVLQDATFGIQQGRSCALGRFHPISREDAEALLNPQPEPPPKTPLETPPIEEVVKPPTPEE